LVSSSSRKTNREAEDSSSEPSPFSSKDSLTVKHKTTRSTRPPAPRKISNFKITNVEVEEEYEVEYDVTPTEDEDLENRGRRKNNDESGIVKSKKPKRSVVRDHVDMDDVDNEDGTYHHHEDRFTSFTSQYWDSAKNEMTAVLQKQPGDDQLEITETDRRLRNHHITVDEVWRAIVEESSDCDSNTTTNEEGNHEEASLSELATTLVTVQTSSSSSSEIINSNTSRGATGKQTAPSEEEQDQLAKETTLQAISSPDYATCSPISSSLPATLHFHKNDDSENLFLGYYYVAEDELISDNDCYEYDDDKDQSSDSEIDELAKHATDRYVKYRASLGQPRYQTQSTQQAQQQQQLESSRYLSGSLVHDGSVKSKGVITQAQKDSSERDFPFNSFEADEARKVTSIHETQDGTEAVHADLAPTVQATPEGKDDSDSIDDSIDEQFDDLFNPNQTEDNQQQTVSTSGKKTQVDDTQAHIAHLRPTTRHFTDANADRPKTADYHPFDDQNSRSTNNDEIDEYNPTPVIDALARSRSPSQHSLEKQILNISHSSSQPDADSTSGTDRDEVEVVDGIDYYLPEQVYKEGDRKIHEEKRKQAALSLATAAILQRGNLSSHVPATIPESCGYDGSISSSNQGSVGHVSEHTPSEELTEREKRFSLYIERGIYFRSSEDLSESHVAHESFTSNSTISPVPRKVRPSIYDENQGPNWRKWLGSLFLKGTSLPQTKKEDVEVPIKDEATKNTEATDTGIKKTTIKIIEGDEEQVYDLEDDDDKKKYAKMIAAGALFKKNDLSHVDVKKPDRISAQPKLFVKLKAIPVIEDSSSDEEPGLNPIAAAAAAIAQKRKEKTAYTSSADLERMLEDRITKPNPEKDSSPRANPLAVEAAALAAKRKKTSMTAEDYENLFKKHPPERKEPQMMVKLRSVRRENLIRNGHIVIDENNAPKSMGALHPISREGNKSKICPSSPVEAVSKDQSLCDDDIESQEESVSSASSLFGADVATDKRCFGRSGRSCRHFARGILLLALLAAIALPLYFFVFDDSDSSNHDSSSGTIGGITPPTHSSTTMSPSTPVRGPTSPPISIPTAPLFPPTTVPIPTSGPAATPSPTPESVTVPTSFPTTMTTVATTAAPTSVPSTSPVEQIVTDQPTLPPTVSTQIPTAGIDSELALRELLVSKWPPLSRLFDSIDGIPSAALKALTWLAEDPNLNSYSDAKKIQRFTLAHFYYSTGGEDWVHADEWLIPSDECTWYTSSTFREACDVSGSFVNLELQDEGLKGQLPAELALLSNNLQRLVLESSAEAVPAMLGTIPSEFGLLTKLEYLSLTNYNLGGTVPSEVGQLALLAVVDLSSNTLEGSIPTTLGSLKLLNNLYLRSNNLEGSIPIEVGNLQSLVNLDLHGNKLSSTIPSSLFQHLSGLQGGIDLSNNNLTGVIPSTVGQLTGLRATLDLSFNQLSSTIPVEMGRLVLLRRLLLNNNLLTGLIPLSLANMEGLTQLDLSSNDLVGSVPPFVCNALVTDRVTNNARPALFTSDCISEVDCPCCQYCCDDATGCECLHAGTSLEYLCTNPE
jgi:hypothetical protein